MPFTVLDNDGVYKGKVLAHDFEQVGKNETLAYTLSVELTHKEVRDEDGGLGWEEMEDPQRREIRNWFNKPENIERSLSSLRALGFDGGDNIEYLDPSHPKAFDFSKSELVVKVTTEENDRGYVNENFRIQKTRQAVASDVKKNLLADLKAQLKAHKAEKKSDEEEVPFD